MWAVGGCSSHDLHYFDVTLAFQQICRLESNRRRRRGRIVVASHDDDLFGDEGRRDLGGHDDRRVQVEAASGGW